MTKKIAGSDKSKAGNDTDIESKSARRFGMHANLLYDVITKQAGSLQKAILEGVMNAIDAGARRCDITLDSNSLVIADDGKGFADLGEIEAFFEVFGTPHQEGDARYGRFRMGRGQLFSFGVNRWLSNRFEMQVDIKNRGLDYELIERAKARKGTRIEIALYNPLLPSELESCFAELKRFVAFAGTPVSLNGERISKDPAKEKWSLEDDNAYYRLSDSKGTLEIYNLGVLVASPWAGRYGTGGLVVSKKQLEVNFARNDVQSSCKVMAEIAKVLRRQAGSQSEKKTRLTEVERHHIAQCLLVGDYDGKDSLDRIKVLTDVTGRHWPVTKLGQLGWQFKNRLVVAERGNRIAETAMKRQLCFALAEETLERFNAASFADLVAGLKRAGKAYKPGKNSPHRFNPWTYLLDALEEVELIELETLSDVISETHQPLDSKTLTKAEQLMLGAIEAGANKLQSLLHAAAGPLAVDNPGARYRRTRRIRAGLSETAEAWTDGVTTIWINRRLLKRLLTGYGGCYQLALLLLHEYLHDGPDSGTHSHDHAFFEAFHEVSLDPGDPVGKAATAMAQRFTKALRSEGKRPSKAFLAIEDHEVQVARDAPRLAL